LDGHNVILTREYKYLKKKRRSTGSVAFNERILQQNPAKKTTTTDELPSRRPKQKQEWVHKLHKTTINGDFNFPVQID
jgi:hypothetical protein